MISPRARRRAPVDGFLASLCWTDARPDRLDCRGSARAPRRLRGATHNWLLLRECLSPPPSSVAPLPALPDSTSPKSRITSITRGSDPSVRRSASARQSKHGIPGCRLSRGRDYAPRDARRRAPHDPGRARGRWPQLPPQGTCACSPIQAIPIGGRADETKGARPPSTRPPTSNEEGELCHPPRGLPRAPFAPAMARVAYSVGRAERWWTTRARARACMNGGGGKPIRRREAAPLSLSMIGAFGRAAPLARRRPARATRVIEAAGPLLYSWRVIRVNPARTRLCRARRRQPLGFFCPLF